MSKGRKKEPDRNDCLAMLASLGIATPEEFEELARATLEGAGVAVRAMLSHGGVSAADAPDIIQDTALKAIGRVRKYDPLRAQWRTLTGIIAAGKASEYNRRNAKRREIPLESLPPNTI